MPEGNLEDGAEPKLDPALLKLIHALADMQARADHKREMEEARLREGEKP